MIAIMPERLARLATRSTRLAILEPPFGLVEMVEAAYWQPSRSDDPAIRWLLSALQDAARDLLRLTRSGSYHPGDARHRKQVFPP